MNEALLQRYLDLVLEANKLINITGIRSFEQAWQLHIEDSLAGLEELCEVLPGPLADLGSGAGFPGIPLAIESGRSTTLVESINKKAELLQSFKKELGLYNVEVFNGRIEQLSQQRPGFFSAATARALASLAALVELASPLLKSGGRLIAYKAKLSEEEFNNANKTAAVTGMSFKNLREISIGGHSRQIVVFEKTGSAARALPRKFGLAQKRPLD